MHPGFRECSFDEGLVVIDPWTWQTHLIPQAVVPLLALLRSRVTSGRSLPSDLLDDITALPELAPEIEALGEKQVRENLRTWAELAINLYADGNRRR